MSVWFCIPSARANGGTALDWKRAGYKIALCRDQEDNCRELLSADGLVIVRPYEGYSQSVNDLVRLVLALDPECDWCVTGGDDTLPDPNPPGQIARELTAHFGGTFGVMQPTGDRWANGSIDRICGSPWMGREFCERAYGGNGPMFGGYRHMFNDEELQAVALKLGCFLQRRDLTHYHEHFCRQGEGVNWAAPPPAFLRAANSPEHWKRYGALFQQRKAAGFPGHEPCPIAPKIA